MGITNNRINYVIAEKDMDALRAAYETINNILLPFIQPLTIEERIALPKIDVSNKAFVKDAITAIKNNSHFLPEYFTGEMVENDYELFEQLEEIKGLNRSVDEKIEDTQMLAGSESYVNSLTAYRLFGAAALAGLDGADSVYSALKTRFSQKEKPVVAATAK